MIVKVLSKGSLIEGEVGDEVYCEPQIGNYLSTIGVVEIVDHGANADAKSSTIKSTKKKKDTNGQDSVSDAE